MERYLPTLATLLLGHLLGDFPLQTNQIYRWKLQSNLGILIHVVVHVVVTTLLLQNALTAWPLLILLGSGHFIIDWLKLRLPTRTQTLGFIVDQIAHFIWLMLLSLWWPNLQPRLPLDIIYVALLWGVIPVTIMLIWVVTGDIEAVRPDFAYKEIRPSLLRWSQGLGYLLIVGIIIVSGIVFWVNEGWLLAMLNLIFID